MTGLTRRVLEARVWRLLDHPTIFHVARFALVGHQRLTKDLLRQHLAVTPDETVLDVCCGVAEFASAVEGRYVGVDVNERFIQRARQRYAHAPTKAFEVGDVMRLGYPARHFDKAMIVNSLHHFSDEDAGRLLSEVRRITRGRVVIVDADGMPRGPVRRALVALDRGRFMRSPRELAALVARVFAIEETVAFDVGLYTEVLLRCRAAEDRNSSGGA